MKTNNKKVLSREEFVNSMVEMTETLYAAAYADGQKDSGDNYLVYLDQYWIRKRFNGTYWVDIDGGIHEDTLPILEERLHNFYVYNENMRESYEDDKVIDSIIANGIDEMYFKCAEAFDLQRGDVNVSSLGSVKTVISALKRILKKYVDDNRE